MLHQFWTDLWHFLTNPIPNQSLPIQNQSNSEPKSVPIMNQLQPIPNQSNSVPISEPIISQSVPILNQSAPIMNQFSF